MEVMRLLIYGIYLVVFCLPLYLVRFEIFGIPTTVLEVMIYGLFVIWLVQRGYKRIQRDLRGFRGVILPIVLIVIGVTLATIFSSDLRTSTGIWKSWFVDPLLLFVVLVSVIKNSEQIKKVFYSLFLSGTAVSIISLIYLIQGKLDPVGRLQAFYNSPNYLAMYLAPALIIGFGLITRKKIIPSTFILLFVVCLLLSIIFTKSFGAWLGIIVAVGVGLGLYLYKRKKKLILVVICLGLLLILGLGYLKFNQPEADQSLDARLVIWQKAWQVYKNNPILGIGPGTFESHVGVPQPHNIFLAFLLQTGIIGFIGFIWLLIWFYKKRTNIVLMTIMTYILVHGLVDTTYWKNDLAVIFWLMIGLMAVLKKEPR